MDYFFENRYVRTPEMMIEVMKKYLLTRKEVILRDGFLLAMMGCALLAASIGERSTIRLFAFYFILCWLIFFFLFKFVSYRTNARVAIARDQEACNGSLMEAALYLGAESFVFTTSTGSQSIIPYSAMGWVGESENFFILASKKSGQLYVIAKNGFVQGTCEDCRSLLRSKGFKI